jgi:hypothetical protein
MAMTDVKAGDTSDNCTDGTGGTATETSGAVSVDAANAAAQYNVTGGSGGTASGNAGHARATATCNVEVLGGDADGGFSIRAGTPGGTGTDGIGA